MKTYKEYKVKMPAYALSYLVYDDDSGLESHDKQIIDRYMEYYYKESKSVSGSLIIAPNLDTEEYFTWSPAFGLACNVIDTIILILI